MSTGLEAGRLDDVELEGAEDDGTDHPDEPSRALAWLLVVGGGIGFLAAAALLVERIILAGDPSYVPSCSLNPVLSCGSVMVTEQASLFGFPNPIIGVAALPVVIATGMGLLAGARYARWYWLGMQAGVTLALVFMGWLAFQSVYRINALCPYCMVVWAAVVPLFWYVTLFNLRAGRLGLGLARSGLTRTLRDYSLLGPLLVYLVVAGLILERFWDYWRTLL